MSPSAERHAGEGDEIPLALSVSGPARPTLDHPPDDALLQLVFSGECLSGHDPAAVVRAVARALKLDEKNAARLFSGKRVVLKRQLDVAEAHRRIAQFAMLGALLHAEPSRPRSVAPAAARRPTPSDGKANAAVPVDARSKAKPLARTPASRLDREASPASATNAAATSVSRLWPRPQHWVVNGVMVVSTTLLLGVMLGPGLNALWPEAQVSAVEAQLGAAASLPRLPTPAPSAVKQTPMTTADGASLGSKAANDDMPRGMTVEALREYQVNYVSAPDHKAFALSNGGAYGWHAGAATSTEATKRALARCTTALRAGDEGCRVVDADDEWLE